MNLRTIILSISFLILFSCTILFFLYSCHETSKKDSNQNVSKKTLQKKNSLSSGFQPSLDTTVFLSNHSINFVSEINKLKIEILPYIGKNCKTDSLRDLESLVDLYKLLKIETNSSTMLLEKEDSLFYKLNKNRIHNETESYQSKYYYFLLDYIEDGTIISFSNSFVYKRFQPINKKIEVLLLITKIFDNNYGRINTRGVQLDLITYHTLLGKAIDRKRLITAGIGLEDIAYHECFSIDKDYNIITKSFTHLEDEATFIIRQIEVDSNGRIIDKKQTVKTE